MKAVIFDMDGTLSDPSHRVHHLDGEKDWKAFHGAMGDDAPNEGVVALARILKRAAVEGLGIDAVLVVTARHDAPEYERMTREWLELHDVPYDRLYMRREDDTRPDHVVKAEILQRILDEGYEPILAIDDRDSTVAMWRDHGITTLQCPVDATSSAYAGQTLLHMLVGPCGAGKSTYAAAKYEDHQIVSTDRLRMELYGDLGHSPEALARVWKLTYGIIRARLEAGVFTVLDATNLEQEDRLGVLGLLPRNVFAQYVVIDRDLRDKERDRGWRTKDLIMKQHRLFRKEEAAIMNGDDQPWVKVQDRRARWTAT
jgi:predicted kinase